MDVAVVTPHISLWTVFLKPQILNDLVFLETEVTIFGKEDNTKGESCDARRS